MVFNVTEPYTCTTVDERARQAWEEDGVVKITGLIPPEWFTYLRNRIVEILGAELLIWGDLIHWPIVQFRRPDAAMIYDVDPIQATATRRQILRESATSGRLVAGMHLFFPPLTRVRHDGDAFAMAPYPWGHDDAIRMVQGEQTGTNKKYV